MIYDVKSGDTFNFALHSTAITFCMVLCLPLEILIVGLGIIWFLNSPLYVWILKISSLRLPKGISHLQIFKLLSNRINGLGIIINPTHVKIAEELLMRAIQLTPDILSYLIRKSHALHCITTCMKYLDNFVNVTG